MVLGLECYISFNILNGSGSIILDNNQERLIAWQKRNFKIRVIILVVLIIIAIVIITQRFGQPCDSDVRIRDRNGFEVASCEEALDYYAENKLGFDLFPDIGSFGDIEGINLSSLE